jgi:peroxiredoxin
LSAQTVAEQRGLISDPELKLAAALGLPTFAAGGRSFYRRLCLVAEEGAIVKVFDPIAALERNAAEVVAWLESRTPVEASRR